MELTRRDLLKASSALAVALGVEASGLTHLEKALGLEASAGGVPVVWLQAQTCSGCSVSLLNSIYYNTIDDLLVNRLDLDYHPTVMVPSGENARKAAEDAYNAGGYVLVVEGAIPTGALGKYCCLWDGETALAGVTRFARKASFILSVGTCASFGGMAAAAPNPTRSRGLAPRFANKVVVALPGCPAHPDWVVGTIAYILANGAAPALDTYGRPTTYYTTQVIHSTCPLRDSNQVSTLGVLGCMRSVGCKGPSTHADCHKRLWNSSAANTNGVNFCMYEGCPCLGCVEPGFPDGTSPFYQGI